MTIKKHLWILLAFSFSVFGDKVIEPPHQSDVPNPWFTGPLLAPSYSVVPLGHVNYEPYFDLTTEVGVYGNSWETVKASHATRTFDFQPFIEIGLGMRCDLQLAPVLAYNYCHHQASWVFGDFPVIIDVQILEPHGIEDWTPYIKLVLTEVFPTGKYNKLDPKKRGTDGVGSGAFTSQIGLVIGEMFRLSRDHFMTARLFMQYSIPTKVHLQGFNTYGGGYGTKGTFTPFHSFEADFAIEILLAKHWAFACDFVGTWTSKTHFSGKAGVDAFGLPASIGSNKAGILYAMAPAIEYNWSDQLGLIGGGWFSLAGKNANKFWNLQFAINYYQ